MTRHSFIYLMLFLYHHLFPLPVSHATPIEAALQRMEAAFSAVTDYQSKVEVTSAGRGGSLTRERFLYTFKRPKRIRIDFEDPHPGMVVIYSNKDGKVRVRPWGTGGIFEFHLSPESFLLRRGSGQRVDQTDLGLLILKIRESMEGHRKGTVELNESEGRVEISVAAENHFRRGLITRYRFSIDKQTGLPVQVEESSLEGAFERRILFLNLRTNIGVPDGTFE